MVLSKNTLAAIRAYQSTLDKKSAGLSASELRDELGISERSLRQLMRAGIVKFAGFRAARSVCNQKFNQPVYEVATKGLK